MSNEKIILVGGGGHCKSCIEVVESTDKYLITHILDVPQKVGESILDYKINGTDDDIDLYLEDKRNSFLLTIGQTKSAHLRKKLFQKIIAKDGNLPIIISSKALVSKRTQIGRGSIIMHAAVLNADVIVGENCIINNNVNLEHDAKIGNHTHIATNAVINGNCIIGNEVLIGSNSVVLHGVNITDFTIIGAGSVVVKDIVEPGVYVGNPAKKIKSL